MKLRADLDKRPRMLWSSAVLGFLALVGFLDYWTGAEYSFSVFYLLGIGLATWFLGKFYGLVVSALSVAVWLVGDWKAGVHYSSPLVPIWNATILLTFYSIVVWLLGSLHSLHAELENRVRQRTKALTEEMAENERLEKEIIEFGEREHRRIGRDLHDNLCQHLTGTALAGQVLREKLESQARPEAEEAGKIVALAKEGILMARGIARGIYPVEVEAEGLMAAFRELSASLTKWSKVECVFELESPVLVEDAALATHLYRIAQEAVGNAIRHGKPNRVIIALSEEKGRITMTVEDDGGGLPEGWQAGGGLGTRIMAHRAAMAGGNLKIDLNPTGGTVVRCSFPITGAARKEKATQHERHG